MITREDVAKLRANDPTTPLPTTADGGQASEGSTLGAVPTYPVDALPAAAHELVRHGTETGLPEALLAGAALAALAAAIGSAAQIEVAPSWHERAILWVPLLAPRGAGKSPAQDLAFGPLREYDAQLGEDDERSELLLGDATLEALARRLGACDGACALDLDEMAVLLRGLGEYKRGGGGDRGRFLQLWTGTPWKLVRVGTGKSANAVRLRITRPTVVVCGGLQPALHELLGDEESGMRPRWLPHLATMPQDAGRLGGDRPPIGWQLLIGGGLLPQRGASRTWRLDAGARATFERYRATWKAQARKVETASTAAALWKADIHLARVALALAEAQAPATGGEVCDELIERAAAIIRYTLDCWRALPEQEGLTLSRRDATLDRGIARLIAWLEERGGQATRRQLQRAHVAGVRTPDELRALLERYEATHPGAVTEEQPGGGGLSTIVVRAPLRHPVMPASPPGDTVLGTTTNGGTNAKVGAVARGDSVPGDTACGDSATRIDDGELAPEWAERMAERYREGAT